MTLTTFLITLIAITIALILVKLVLSEIALRTYKASQDAAGNSGLAGNSEIAQKTGYQEPGYTFPNGIKLGNTQFIGGQDFQSNYFATIPKDNSLLAVIADGLNDSESGKLAAVIAVETLKHNFKSDIYRALSTEAFFEESFRQMQKNMIHNISLNKFGVKLAAIIADGGILNYAAIGDCAIYIYRNKEFTCLTADYEKHIGRISLNPKDIVMLTSRGALENLTEMEIIWYLDLEDHPQEKCQLLLKRAREKRIRQENSTIIMLEDLPAAPAVKIRRTRKNHLRA